MASQFQIPASLVTEGIRALARNKMRSALAALGITIGIAAVVCVVAIGNAGSERLEKQLQNLGENVVWVEAGSRNVNGVRTGTHGMNTLTTEDSQAILREIKLVKRVSPFVDSRASVTFGNRNWTTQYRGVGPDYPEIKRWEVADGVFFTDEEVQQVSNVCVLGKTVSEQLFGVSNPVGSDVKLNHLVCHVVGVLAPKGQSTFGQDQDDTILIPYTTAQKKLRGKGYLWLDDIYCSATSAQAVNPAAEQISALLRQRHHIRPGQDDDFNIRRPEELIKAQLETKRTLALFLIGIASISLLVGGIGILNVMLVSVTQRTREIGLRLAVGATGGHVQTQFLLEAMILSLFGGLMGILLGVSSSFVFGHLSGWPMSIPPQALAVAPAFSIGVGMFFGFYPARRASLLDPIAALRYE